MLWRSSHRRHHHVAIAVLSVDEGGAAKLSRLPTPRGQEERVDPVPAVTAPPTALGVGLDMVRYPAFRAVIDLLARSHDFSGEQAPAKAPPARCDDLGADRSDCST